MSADMPLFLWASVGDPAVPVSRVEVISCEHCAALVPADRADEHLRWHRRTQPARSTITTS